MKPVVLPPLSAQIDHALAEHNGKDRFTVRIAFSEDILFNMNQEEPRSGSSAARCSGCRVDRRDDLWEFKVELDDFRSVTVALKGGHECGRDGALCTADGLWMRAARQSG